MATLSVQRTAQRAFSLKEWTKAKSESVRSMGSSILCSLSLWRGRGEAWLSAESRFYSRIAEFPVTRRLVVRVNAVSLCMLLSAIAIEQQPLVAITFALCAGWLVYRINQTDKKGGEQ